MPHDVADLDACPWARRDVIDGLMFAVPSTWCPMSWEFDEPTITVDTVMITDHSENDRRLTGAICSTVSNWRWPRLGLEERCDVVDQANVGERPDSCERTSGGYFAILHRSRRSNPRPFGRNATKLTTPAQVVAVPDGWSERQDWVLCHERASGKSFSGSRVPQRVTLLSICRASAC
jgi:hypothetical protein